MYKNDGSYEAPADTDAKIWRYMSLGKFITLISRRTLFFSRTDRFSDLFEGTFPEGDLHALRRKLITLEGYAEEVQWTDQHGNPSRRATPEEMETFNTVGGLAKIIRSCTFVNCWHINNYENDGMWARFVPSSEGVAIQSTFGNLCQSLAKEPLDVHIGVVEYADYGMATLLNEDGSPNLDRQFVTKQMAYDHERELRALCTLMSRDPSTIGLNIQCIPETLIQNIYVSPNSSEWFLDAVNVTLRAFRFRKRAHTSQLKRKPVW